MDRGVVIVAGGSGSRMGSAIPKQYLDLEGKPVIVRTLEKFIQFDPRIRIVVVLAPDHGPHWDEVAAVFRPARGILLANGGTTRYESVKNGLALMDDGMIVGIHDAVRPLVSLDTLERCYKAAAEYGSAVPVMEMEETVRMLGESGGSAHLDRSRLRRVQTPQVFQSEQIRKAYDRPYDPGYTDDASVYESLFGDVVLVDGNTENIKITGPHDLLLASILLRS